MFERQCKATGISEVEDGLLAVSMYDICNIKC